MTDYLRRGNPKSTMRDDSVSRPPVGFVYRVLTAEDVVEAMECVVNDESDDPTACRVDFIYTMMRECRWHKGRTYKELAVVWNLDQSTVKKASAEARRRFLATLEDPEVLRAEILGKLEHVMNASLTAQRPFLDKNTGCVVYAEQPDYRAAICAAAEMGKLTGLYNRKVEHTIINKHEGKDIQELLLAYQEEKRLKEQSIDTTGNTIDGDQRLAQRLRGSIRREGKQSPIHERVRAQSASAPVGGDPGDESGPGT